jgi:hypothetical protein
MQREELITGIETFHKSDPQKCYRDYLAPFIINNCENNYLISKWQEFAEYINHFEKKYGHFYVSPYPKRIKIDFFLDNPEKLIGIEQRDKELMYHFQLCPEVLAQCSFRVYPVDNYEVEKDLNSFFASFVYFDSKVMKEKYSSFMSEYAEKEIVLRSHVAGEASGGFGAFKN